MKSGLAHLPTKKAINPKSLKNTPSTVVDAANYSTEELDSALTFMASDAVLLKEINGKGELSGELIVNTRDSNVPVKMTIKLMPNGRFLCTQHSGARANRRIHALALALKMANALASRRRNKTMRNLMASAPAWIGEDFRLSAPIMAGGLKKRVAPIEVRDICDLQGYWMLLDIALTKDLRLPAADLVRHVLKRYENAPWLIQRMALEAMLRRIESARQESLIIAKAPANKAIFGTYRVRRRRQSLRPYLVLLRGNEGVQASCSCPDFARNTLVFCKHIATVLNHWSQKGKYKRAFLQGRVPRRPHLRWTPPVSLESCPDPLTGLQLHVPKISAIKSKTSGRPLALTKFFSATEQGKILPPPPRTDAAARGKYLKKLIDALKAFHRSIDIDAAIPPLLARELDKVHWPERAPDFHRSFAKTLVGLKQKLYPYQNEGVREALAKGRFLLGDDMGLGKTTQAIAWTEALLDSGLAERVLVICPNALKAQWRREWGLVSGREVRIVEGSPTDRQACYRQRSGVLILNYELTLRDMDEILRFNADAVILDEAQRIKNYASQTAKQVKCLKPPFRLILTGTPMENRIQEFVSLMDWIDEEAMGPLWRIDAMQMMLNDADASAKASNLNFVRQASSPYFLRRRRADVLTQLPPRTDTVLPVTVTDEQMAIHGDLAAKVIRLMRILDSRSLSPEEHLRLMSYLTRMRIVSNGMAQYDFDQIWPSLVADQNPEKRVEQLSSPKLLAFRSLIEGLLAQPDVKVVIFSQWRRMLKLCHWSITDVLKNHEAEAVFFTGAENVHRRTEHLVRFHDDPKVRLFFATDAGGVGLNLQRAANVCINLELPWNPAVLEQRIGRIYRLGQETPVQIFKLTTLGTIEERISSLVEQKRAIFEVLFDGGTDMPKIEKSSGFYHHVRQVMEDKAGAADVEEFVDVDAMEEKDDLFDEPFLDSGEFISTPPQPMGASEPRGDDLTSRMAAGEGISVPAIPAAALARAMQSMRVTTTPTGGLRLEAEQESAALLAEVFAGMAALFAQRANNIP